MSNTLTALLPTLIAEKSLAYLRTKSGFLGRTYVETTQESILRGGSSVVIPKPAALFTPTDVSYASAATPQNIVIPSVTLNFTNHKEVKVAANELESRISQGNFSRILDLTIPGMLDGLVSTVDTTIAQLYSSVGTTPVGTAGTSLTDTTLREGVATLAANNVNVQQSEVYLITTPGVYYNQLMSQTNYVQTYAIGTDQTVRGGKIPTLYGVNVDYSPNIVTTATSPVTIENMMFERNAFVVGFVQFEPATANAMSAPVDEAIVTDPETGISLRVQKYYDASVRTWYYQIDIKWGAAVLDENRAVVVKA
jgi:hypothetical protein